MKLRGKPHRFIRNRIFYHGTDVVGNLSEVHAGAKHDHPTSVFGLFFTPDREIAQTYGKRVVEARLNLKNPYIMSYWEAQGFESKDAASKFKEELIRRGHDGVYIEPIEYGGNPQVAVFKTSDINQIPNQSRPSETEATPKPEGGECSGIKYEQISEKERGELERERQDEEALRARDRRKWYRRVRMTKRSA